MNASKSRAFAALWALLMAFSFVNVAVRGVQSAGLPIDALLLPLFLVAAAVAARLAKGEPLLGSHALAGRQLVAEHGGESGGGPLRSTLHTTIDGVTGDVAFAVGNGGVVITLTPDPPLDARVLIHGQGPADQPAVAPGDRFPGTAQDALLRGDVRGPADALAPALDRELRDALDSDIATYRLRVADGALRAIVPYSWKAARITLAVEELFHLARRLAVPPDEAPARLWTIVEEDPDPGFRRAAAQVLLEAHADSPEAGRASTQLLTDRDAELVLLAAKEGEEGAAAALRRLVRTGGGGTVEPALSGLERLGAEADVIVGALSERLRDRLAGLNRDLPAPLWRGLGDLGHAEELALLRAALDGSGLDSHVAHTAFDMDAAVLLGEGDPNTELRDGGVSERVETPRPMGADRPGQQLCVNDRRGRG